MRNEKKSINLFAIILGASTILALVLFLFLNVGENSHFGGIAGFNSIFGVKTTLANGKSLNFNGVNGVGITIFILFIVNALFSGLFGNYKRGFFIASTVVDVALAIMIFTYHSSWIRLNYGITFTVEKTGIGEILSGILVCLHALANIVAFKFADNTRR